MNDPAPYPEDRPRAATVRSRLMLEVSSELVGLDDWPYKQVRVDLRAQGSENWSMGLFASDGLDGIAEVLAGQAHFAILNPATAVRNGARRLRGSDGEPALRSIATIPSYDQLGLAVPADLGLETLDQLAEAKPKLVVSLRGARPNHTVHMVIDDVLAAVGFGLSDIEDWGGSVRYDEGLPHQGDRARSIVEGTTDAVFDEGIYNWVGLAHDVGLRFLTLSDDAFASLVAQGYRKAILRPQRFPVLGEEVATVDFSGFLIYTHEKTPAVTVEAFCRSLAARQDRIPWQGGPTLPLSRMCSDTVDAPLSLPLHPAAERYWRDGGYLGE